MRISDVRFVSAPPDVSGGLLGWVACTLDGELRLDGIAVRRSLAGRLVLSFPIRSDRHGNQHAIVRPIDHAARIQFEEAIFAAIPGMEALR